MIVPVGGNLPNKGDAATPEILVKSKGRVKAYGEVFTPRHMVDQMLDLVSDELESGSDFVDKTFLEPAAGDGNFLLRILQRKLAAIQKRYPRETWLNESLFALASIYAIELLEDNHRAAQSVLLGEFQDFHRRAGNDTSPGTDLDLSARCLIEANILQGNTLTGMDANGKPIVFSWWNRVDASAPSQLTLVQREAFSFDSLRSPDLFDFNTYPTYIPCPISHVYKEVKANG